MASEDTLKLVGTTVADKYDVESVIGDGGFSVVYRAVHRIWNEPVALKCFTALANAPERLREPLIEGFIREGKVMAQLSSETAAIAQARDIGSLSLPDGRWIPYLVLEWLDGRTLAAVLDDELAAKTKARDLRQSVELLAGPLDALARAHDRGVAHLDVKPDNLFVVSGSASSECRTKILDFGVAKLVDANVGAGGGPMPAELISCTPTYAAPEQFNPQRGETGPHTDVYAMALVLVELLRGGNPAVEGTTEEMARKSQDATSRPTPRALGISVPDQVEAIFARALRVEPSERYPKMRPFYSDLRHALGVVANPAPQHRDRSPSASGRFGAPDLTTKNVAPPVVPPVVPPLRPADLSNSLASGATVASDEPLPRRPPTGDYTPNPFIPPPPPHGARPVPPPTEPTLPPEPAPEPVAASLEVAPTEMRVTDDDDEDPVPERPRSSSAMLWSVAALVGIAAGVAFAVKSGSPDEETGGGAGGPVDGNQASAIPGGAPDRNAPPSPGVTEPVRLCPKGMVHIKGGKFFMGTDSEDRVLGAAKPAHQEVVDTFCLDIHEVTVGEYRACSTKGECKRAFRESFWPRGSSNKRSWEKSRKAHSALCNENFADRGDHAINCVTWQQADHYCGTVGRRLPLEKEWEYAARGSDGRIYPWGDAVPDEVHMNGCGAECNAWRLDAGLDSTPVLHDKDDGFPGTSPVGTFKKGRTAHGLEDMIGNVFEWTAEKFAPYGKEPDENEGGRYVIRGGAFNSYMPSFADPALRFGMDADAHSHGIGFRCAADPQGGGDKASP